jgi:hypothetical protein
MVYIFTTVFKGIKLISTKIRLEFYYQMLMAVFIFNVQTFRFYLFNVITFCNNRLEGGDEVGHRNKVMIFECSEE